MERRAIGIVSLLLAFLFSAYVGLYLLAQSSMFKRWLITRLSQDTGYTVTMDELRFAIPFGFVASAVNVSALHGPLLQADEVIVTVYPLDLFSRTVHRVQLRHPTIYIDLEELPKLSNNMGPTLALRHLAIEQGNIMLKAGTDRKLDFHSVSLNIDDVNLGEATGVKLRAEVPRLAASAEISIHSGAEETQADIRLFQKSRGPALTLPASKQQSPGVLSAAITLHKNNKDGLVAAATGEVDQFTLGDEYVSGRFEIHSKIDAGFHHAAFDGTFALHDTSLKIGPARPITPHQAATVTLSGEYSLVDNIAHVQAVRVQSAWGTAEATTAIGFAPRLNLANGRATLRNVPAPVLQQFLPDRLRGLSVNGTLGSELQFGGYWPDIRIAGVAHMHGAQVKHAQWSVAQVSIKAPFEWGNDTVFAQDVQIHGRLLSATRPDRMTLGAEEISATATLRRRADDPLSAAGNVRLLGGRFASADGSKIGENFALTARFEAALSGEKEVTWVAANLEAQQGELLWGKFFGDVSTRPARLEVNLEYRSPSDSIILRHCNIFLAGIGGLQLAGAIERISSSPAVVLDIKSESLQPGGVFDFFIRDTLKLSYPILDRLNIAGSVDLSSRLEGGPDRWTAQGDMRVRAGDISEKAGNWQVGPFELALPFRIHSRAATTDVAEPAAIGKLAIASAHFGSERLLPFRTTLSVWNNALEFHQPLALSAYGGIIEIRGLRWKDFLNDPQDLAFSLNAKDLQLQRVTENLGWHPFAGVLNASIPKIESMGDALRTGGEILVDVFGGRVRIAPVEVQNPFSALFSVRLNTRFEEINLELASENFEFGRISGILEGTVNDLIITNGQPAQFTAVIHTVPKSGVGQWISVEALDKITVLSSGNDAGALYGGLAGFFDNFRYSRLGFKATLKNDRLMLRGVESRDGKEYLVVGTLFPPSVNIISHTQEIGFGELIRRLERIGASGGPEVK